MNKGAYFHEELDEKAIFGCYLIIAAGIGLILGAFLPWARFINDGQGTISGLDGAGKYTAVIALPMIIAGYYRMKSSTSAGGIVAIVLSLLAAIIGISRLIAPRLIAAHYYYSIISIKVDFGVHLTVFAGIIGIIGGVMTIPSSLDSFKRTD